MDNKQLPFFKYNPNAYTESEIFYTVENTCECCGKKTTAWFSFMYCAEDVECICAECIHSGAAAEKFNGTFIDFAEDGVTDQEKIDELEKRTPGYDSWQGERWQVCCEDYCAFIAHVGQKELDELGIPDSVIQECIDKCGFEFSKYDLDSHGSMVGYLFQCLHCGKYHLVVDCD